MVGAGNGTKKDHRGGDGRRTPFDLEHYETNESRIDLDCEKALALLAPQPMRLPASGPKRAQTTGRAYLTSRLAATP